MSLEIKNEEKNDISEEEIQEFQKNLAAHIQATMAVNNEDLLKKLRIMYMIIILNL